MRPRKTILFSVIIGCLLATTQAFAHGAGTVVGGGFESGFLHPLFGWDHVAAMVAVGLWGAVLGPPAIWLLPVTFPLVMAFGAVLALAGISLPFIEAGIAASALVIGLMVALASKPQFAVATVIVAAFAIFHGYAHGAEMPVAASGLAYAIGFVIATGLLHLVGIAIGLFAKVPHGMAVVRGCGAVIAIAGAVFLSGAMA